MNEHMVETLFVVFPEVEKHVECINSQLRTVALNSRLYSCNTCIERVFQLANQKQQYQRVHLLVWEIYQHLTLEQQRLFTHKYVNRDRPNPFTGSTRTYYRSVYKMLTKASHITDALGYTDKYFADFFDDALFKHILEDITRRRHGNS